jgi:hypothetical protein
VKNRRGVARALMRTPALTVAAAVIAVVAAALPAAASAATTQPSAPQSGTPQLETPQLGGTDLGAAQLAAAALGNRGLGGTHLGAGALGNPDLGGTHLGAITGIVRGADGTALGGACVMAAGSAGATLAAPGLTRPDGRYLLGGLRPGVYTVSYTDCAHPARYFAQWYGDADVAAAATRIAVGVGRPTELLPVTLRLTSPMAEGATTQRALSSRLRAADGSGRTADSAGSGQVSGVVRNRAGRPLASVCVISSTHTADSGIIGSTPTGRHGGYSTNIGTSGKWQFEFTGGCGNPGNFAPQWWRHVSTPKKATDLHARRGKNFRGIDAVLRPGAAIAGTVRSTSGRRLGGVCVVALGLGAMSQVEVQATTRPNGAYVIKDLGTGRYRVQFQPFCGQRGDFLNSFRRAVAVTDGKTTRGINGTLRPGGSISGVVTSQATGAKLAGICVLVERDTSGNGLSSGGFFGDITGKSGTYSNSRLAPGQYMVSFQAGCGNSGSYAPQAYDAMTNPADATPVTVAAGHARTGIDAAMRPGGTITGRVTSQAGTALAGVCVLVTAQADAGGFGQDPLLALALDNESFVTDIATTGKAGRFSVANLTPGPYSAEFEGCGGSSRFAARTFAPQGGHQPTWVSVNGGSVTANVSARLQPGGAISGVVTGKSGRRLSGICVLASQPGNAASAVTEDFNSPQTRRGAYRITGLATGRYAVEFVPCQNQPYASQWYRGKSTEASARLVSVRDGHTTTAVNARLGAGGTISGRIVSGIARGPVNQACVIVTDSTGAPVTFGLTGKSGQFRIPHVPAGRWVLDPSLCITASPALAAIVRRGVLVRNTATTKVTIVLPRAGRIAGTVRGGSPAAAAPGLCVEVTPRTGDGEPGIAVTGPHGGYTLAGLAPGRYQVKFTPLCPAGTAGLVPQWFRGQPSRATATPVTVTAGHITAGIGGTLVADGGISGTVTRASAAVKGVCVGAYAGTATTPAALAITGANGSYQISNLEPGRYHVEFSSGCGVASYATVWFSGAASRAAAAPVTVSAGSITPGINAS